MAKRTYIKDGDIFEVILDNNLKRYFQLIGADMTMLNSNVIRVFKGEYEKQPSLSELAKSDVDFHAHCIIRLGMKLKLWHKIGNSDIKDITPIMFRETPDYGTGVRTSSKWNIWSMNKEMEEYTSLSPEQTSYDIGIVISPHGIIEKIRTGKFNSIYPEPI